ncbi:hypothetical protein SAMN05421810_106204 [Amycolatopsis arida]|uniref:Uncharacterized protein n=1 Tax=Amycolatopsis arida TaxID=587909 RepID=A0A1I5XQL7_9PSEU|nr:hypothetical protein CLV69_102417 [Amycolatopsis arida]SFQ34244.1 hypothetical protein SAMN05421810_106204 [Amycolatopsis arida]
MVTVDLPSWAPVALSLASIAVVAAALVVVIRMWRNNRDR